MDFYHPLSVHTVATCNVRRLLISVLRTLRCKQNTQRKPIGVLAMSFPEERSTDQISFVVCLQSGGGAVDELRTWFVCCPKAARLS